jgi:hypothetical protein
METMLTRNGEAYNSPKEEEKEKEEEGLEEESREEDKEELVGKAEEDEWEEE